MNTLHNSREFLKLLIDEAEDIVVPIIAKAIKGLRDGVPPERLLTQTERDALAASAQRGIDAALAHARGPRPGTGV